MNFSVVHLCFGRFNDPWERFNPLKNGTEAEIAELTDLEVYVKNNYVNHLIITFDNVDDIKVKILHSSYRLTIKNTVRIQIPDFLFKKCKKDYSFKESYELLTIQVMKALNLVKIDNKAIVHFHSWESGFLFESDEFKSWLNLEKMSFFSPYLTVSRLKQFMEKDLSKIYTLNYQLCKLASEYEIKLIKGCKKTILESHQDYGFYSSNIKSEYSITSFTKKNNVQYKLDRKEKKSSYNFISGGRPVYEKGFMQLVTSFKKVQDWGDENGLSFGLDIYCLDSNQNKEKHKHKQFIIGLRDVIKTKGLEKLVTLKNKVSESELINIISKSDGLIIPSLYDPFCLMPKYAFESESPSFVSKYTGISESITSKEYVFDPLKETSLLESIQMYIDISPCFQYENLNKSFVEIYIN